MKKPMKPKIEIRVTLPDFYKSDQQNFWHQTGHFYTGQTTEECLEKAKKEHGSQRINWQITCKWDETGEIVYRSSGPK
jgi:hypothetical protein